jgi:hypothetical protein
MQSMDNKVTQFPSQKKSYSQKNEAWRKKNIDAADGYLMQHHRGLRKSQRNKVINFNLYSDILDPADVEKIANPFKIKGLKTSPDEIKNYAIANPKIDVLVGEKLKRFFDIKVRVINDDAITEKEEDLLQEFRKVVTRYLESDAASEEDLKKDLQEFQRFRDYDYQDLRERAGTHILKHLKVKQKLDEKFVKGFKNALIAAEELYEIDIVAGEPVVNVLNPKNTHIIMSGESPYVEDADIVILEKMMSPGQIIDNFHDKLTPKEIDKIEQYSFSGTSGVTGKPGGIDIGDKYYNNLPDMVDTVMFEKGISYKSNVDEEGNIRVMKVLWRSRRKMLKVTYFDEFGDEQESIEDESYKINKDLGESSEVIWINEAWEGWKIGASDNVNDGIYVGIQPRVMQFRELENPSKCHLGIVGTIYQTNDNKAVSLMDRMKPYQYMYNILAYNTELLISKNLGKIMSLDLARIPEQWDIDQWMSFAQGMNIAVIDSFKEGNKGQSTGKLAGAMPVPTPVIDMQMGNDIQLYMNMMAFIKSEMGEISGVSAARQGQISERSSVGNVQREVVQSSAITEYWFKEHESTMLRVYSTLLETAKMAWSDKKNKKVQYVLDDGATEIFNVTGEMLTELNFDIAVVNSTMDQNLMAELRQLAHAGLQSGLLNFEQLIDIFSTESISSVKKKMERAQRQQMERAEEQQKREQEMAQQQMQMEAQKLQDEKQFELVKQEREFQDNERDRENALEIERLRNQLRERDESTKERLEQLKIEQQKLKNQQTRETKK